MPFLIAAFLGALAQVMGSLVGRVLLALGISYVTYKGLNIGIDWIYAQMQSSLQSMSSDVVDFLAFLWVDKALSTMFSAYTAAVALKMAGGTSITKMVTKK